MAKVQYDLSEYPIIVQVWPVEISDTDLELYFTEMHALMDKAIASKTPIVVITRQVHASTAEAPVRKRVAAYLNDLSLARQAIVIASIVILNSSVQRGALTALRWTTKKFERVYAVDNLGSAMVLARKVLANEAPSQRKFA